VLGLAIGALLIVISLFLPSFALFSVPATSWIIIGVLSIVCGIVTIFAAQKLNANPQEHTRWGILILAVSLVGLGTIIAVVGGVLALVYKPKEGINQKLDILKATKFTGGFIVLSLVGTMMQHLMGGILYEVIPGQVVHSIDAGAYPGIWNAVFYLYPWERLALIIGAVLIGVPVILILRKSLFPPEKKTTTNYTAKQ
jgi:hypothetical protein